jgi:hypothetical protein
MKKALLAIVMTAILLPANLGAQIAFGVRLATSSGLGNLGPTNLQGGHIGVKLGENAIILGGFDFSKFVAENEERSAVSSFIPFGGIKYFIRDRFEGSVSPYFRGDFFKAISRFPDMGDSALLLVSGLLGPEQVTMTEAEAEEFLEEIFSPWGFTVSFGTEYFFADSFSLGGEFGLKNAFSKAEVNVSEIGGVSTTKARFHDTYVALTLNFEL